MRNSWSKAAASRIGRQRTQSARPGEVDEIDDVDMMTEVEQAVADVALNEGHQDVSEEFRRGTTIGDYDGSINTGFQLSTFVGPLCAEPMMGVCYVVEDIKFDIPNDVDSKLNMNHSMLRLDALMILVVDTKLGLLSGQIISTMKEACRQAFLAYSPRLMLAMYSCDLQAPGMFEC